MYGSCTQATVRAKLDEHYWKRKFNNPHVTLGLNRTRKQELDVALDDEELVHKAIPYGTNPAVPQKWSYCN